MRSNEFTAKYQVLKKILFVYRAGRKERIEFLKSGAEAPTDFLYGFTYFDYQRYITHYIEVSDLSPIKWNLDYWQLRRYDKKFSLNYGIGRASHQFVGYIKYLNQYDLIIGTNDSLSMGLLYFKKVGVLKPKVVFLAMGSGSTLLNLKNIRDPRIQIYKSELEDSIKCASALVLLGKGEHELFWGEYEHWRAKIKFIPFGIDTEFWRPAPKNNGIVTNERYFLFVGNDSNRDYELLLDVAKSCPTESFIFLSSKISPDRCPPNVRLLCGNMWESQVTDQELRELYRAASLVLVPLKDTIQPSGQSVALQAMACGTPIVMTRTQGIWDAEIMKDLENCILVKPGQSEEMATVVRNFSNDTDGIKKIKINGLSTVQNHYESREFARKIERLVDEILHTTSP